MANLPRKCLRNLVIAREHTSMKKRHKKMQIGRLEKFSRMPFFFFLFLGEKLSRRSLRRKTNEPIIRSKDTYISQLTRDGFLRRKRELHITVIEYHARIIVSSVFQRCFGHQPSRELFQLNSTYREVTFVDPRRVIRSLEFSIFIKFRRTENRRIAKLIV